MATGLAFIGRIVDIFPNPNADKIESARVYCGSTNGVWEGVIPKDTFTSGQKVIVFLQDSTLLPGDERWEFMKKFNYIVRMSRFRGAPSECLILDGPETRTREVGEDVTELLGVEKYEKTIPADAAYIGPFLSNVPKTDEKNFQTSSRYITKMGSQPYYITEKEDGTSSTAYVDEGGKLHVYSRQWELDPEDQGFYNQMAAKYKLNRIPLLFALQYEIVGPGIQGNPLQLKEKEIRAFTLYDTIQCKPCSYQELRNLCIDLDIPMPRLITLKENPDDDNIPTFEELRKMAEIVYPGGKPGEGIVVRALDSSWSFKVINLLYSN